MEITLVSGNKTPISPDSLDESAIAELNELVGKMKFVALEVEIESVRTNIAIIFSSGIEHSSVLSSHIKSEDQFLGAGFVKGDGSIIFDSNSCREWLGRDAPVDEEDKESLKSAIEDKTIPLIKYLIENKPKWPLE
ncbi:hypothetical protein HN512_04755 [Candidatus Peregrinibacteria bacterium]|jgi:hypothetical protein|nr:hypothetical protein [Candidatus Peregrinibacteria bacterium]MBT3599115.1 hypothetical protein [Candidatus Peregrinibacteria bacterium]MBT4367503.1 hypothetical protein [Candidatus Peregrinibacteria bacterium]MBT4585985.1 hypothetical protein [Candidatus Peregrinibacteria bacterium]MBT6730755.1 hypothetical protein [Candidatus Peregrinibacteria bacterium]